MPYLAGLDGMRALAVLAVMVYHADSSWLPGGFLGVEAFFVISGYLITLLLIGEHELYGRVAIGSFWARRARRLLPALFTLLIGISLYTALLLSRRPRAAARRDPRPPSCTCRTGTRSGSARGTQPRATSPRCATCGASPSRSSSTSCGHW